MNNELEDMVRRSRPDEIIDLQHHAALRGLLREQALEPVIDPRFAQPWTLRGYLIATALSLMVFGALQLVPHPSPEVKAPLAQSIETLFSSGKDAAGVRE